MALHHKLYQHDPKTMLTNIYTPIGKTSSVQWTPVSFSCGTNQRGLHLTAVLRAWPPSPLPPVTQCFAPLFATHKYTSSHSTSIQVHKTKTLNASWFYLHWSDRVAFRTYLPLKFRYCQRTFIKQNHVYMYTATRSSEANSFVSSKHSGTMQCTFLRGTRHSMWRAESCWTMRWSDLHGK